MANSHVFKDYLKLLGVLSLRGDHRHIFQQLLLQCFTTFFTHLRYCT